MKIIVKIVIPTFIIIAFIFSFVIVRVNAVGEVTYSNGDLRCPPQYLNNGCTEIPDGNGKTNEVQVSFEKEGLNVIKHVAKTSELGVYNVWFNVSGKSSIVKKTTGSANIILVLDNSSSMSRKYYDYVVPAAQKLAQNFKPDADTNSGINLGIIGFNNEPFTVRGLESSNFDSIDPLVWRPNCAKTNIPAGKTARQFNIDINNYSETHGLNRICGENGMCSKKEGNEGKGCVYANSHIHKALAAAYNMFKGAGVIGGQVPNYVVVMGDGKYSGTSINDRWSNLVNDSLNGYNNLVNNGVTIYSIGFGDALNDKTAGKMMKKLAGDDTSRYFTLDAGDDINTYMNTFNIVYTQLSSQVKVTTYSIKLKDRVGSYFDIVGSNARVKNFEGNSFPYTTETFQIEIDQNVSDENNPWYDTNNGFDVIGYDSSDINPQVYWKNSYEYNGCSSAVYQHYTYKDRTTNEYTSIKCDYKLDSTLMMDNKPVGNKIIDLENARGFPVELSLSSDTICNYNFDVQEFINDYNETSNEMANYSEGTREKAYYQKIINRMNGYVNSWSSIANPNINPVSSTLQNYQSSFINSSVDLFVQDKSLNASLTKTINMVTKEGSVNIINPTPVLLPYTKILGVDISSNMQFSLHMSKVMEIPKTCLSMVDGSIVNCNNSSNNQISGDNNAFIPLSMTKGYLSAEVRDATINGGKLRLDGPNNGINPYCEFNNHPNDNNVLFRQIELSDPFVQKYTNNQRPIGKNWNGSNYNFTKAIKGDTWSNDYEYQYTMSKVDVSSIKRNSISNGVISYLGENCKFRDGDNVFICPFIRPSSGGIINNKSSSNIYFTKIRINEKIS